MSENNIFKNGNGRCEYDTTHSVTYILFLKSFKQLKLSLFLIFRDLGALLKFILVL